MRGAALECGSIQRLDGFLGRGMPGGVPGGALGLMQGHQACSAGSLAGRPVANMVGHLEELQPPGLDLQAVPLLIQEKHVDMRGLLLYLQQRCSLSDGLHV